MKTLFRNLLTTSLAALALGSASQAAIVEVSADITADTRFTRDNVYVVTRLIYVLPPAKLTIEPGTVLRGADPTITGFTNSPGTIVVSRGAKIIGNATADDPIIWTSLDDPYVPGGANTIPVNITGQSGTATVTAQNYATDGPTSSNAFAYSKICGGIVILGRTPLGYDRDGDGDVLSWNGTAHGGDTLAYPTDFTGASTGDGTGFALIEGLTASSVVLAQPFDADGAGAVFSPDTTFNPGFFGGVDENDDSGVVRFWSNRYGGFNISANNEINGLTMGAVGRGTVIEFQEVVQNADDGFEWFGGYVGCKYLASIVNGDDCFDGDMGFSGNLQHLVALNDNNPFYRSGFGASNGTFAWLVGRASSANADNMIEFDGSEANLLGVTPATNHWAFNLTFIGASSNVLAGAGRADLPPGGDDSRMHSLLGASGQWARGILQDTPNEGIRIDDNGVTDTDFLDILHFNLGTEGFLDNGTVANDTTGSSATNVMQVRGNAHADRFGFDPRLIDDSSVDSVARDLILSAPTRPGVTDFFSPVGYRAAMRDNNWLFGWSWCHSVELTPASNVDRPALALTVTGGNSVSVSFAVDTDETVGSDKVLYVVERSTDGKSFAPVAAVQDGGAGDADAAVNGSISVTDPIAFTGSPVQYRVIPQ